MARTNHKLPVYALRDVQTQLKSAVYLQLFPPVQAMEEQIGRVREDSEILTNPRFTGEGGSMHEATKQVVDTVKKSLGELNATHQQLITMCQQKRDLFIVCVKFHMTTRQVG